MKTTNRNNKLVEGKGVCVRLVDDEGSALNFVATFSKEGVFSLSETPDDDLTSETVTAQIGYVNISGGAWRDIEAGDYLEDFIRGVLFGDDDAEEQLSLYAEALEVDTPGKAVNL